MRDENEPILVNVTDRRLIQGYRRVANKEARTASIRAQQWEMPTDTRTASKFKVATMERARRFLHSCCLVLVLDVRTVATFCLCRRGDQSLCSKENLATRSATSRGEGEIYLLHRVV